MPGGADSTLGGGAPVGADVPTAGTRIGNFVVERLLGAGAMGVVVLAHDEELDRHVAIELLSPRHDFNL